MENGLTEGEYEVWRNSQWRVTNMVLEELPGGSGYWIAHADLSRPGWIEHMRQKKWVNIEAFKEAYQNACEIAGIAPPMATDGQSERQHHEYHYRAQR